MRASPHLLLAGQSLIKRKVTLDDSLAARIASHALAVTNFEGCVRPARGWPTKDRAASGVEAERLHDVARMGFGAVTLANNHLGDWGPNGVLATLEAASAAGLATAGAGVDASKAWRATMLQRPGGSFAVVAADIGPWAEHVGARDADGAMPARPGVARIRVTRRAVLPPDLLAALREAASGAGETRLHALRSEAGFEVSAPSGVLRAFGMEAILGAAPGIAVEPDEADLAAAQASVAAAHGAGASVVLAVLHNHVWEGDWAATPSFLLRIAERLAHAGASVVAGHGAPVLQPLAWVDGPSGPVPVLSCLGNFVFHSVREGIRRMPYAWRSVLAEVGPRSIALQAVALGDGQGGGERDRPFLWRGDAAAGFLEAFRDRSERNGGTWTLDAAEGRLTLDRAGPQRRLRPKANTSASAPGTPAASDTASRPPSFEA